MKLCKRGHIQAPENQYFNRTNGSRTCNVCRKDVMKKSNARRKPYAGNRKPTSEEYAQLRRIEGV